MVVMIAERKGIVARKPVARDLHRNRKVVLRLGPLFPLCYFSASVGIPGQGYSFLDPLFRPNIFPNNMWPSRSRSSDEFLFFPCDLDTSDLDNYDRQRVSR